MVGSSIEIMDIGTEDPLVFIEDNDVGEPISLIVKYNDDNLNNSFLKLLNQRMLLFW